MERVLTGVHEITNGQVDSIVHGKYLVAGVCDDGSVTMIPDGAVAVADGRIVELGDAARIRQRYRARETFGGSQHVVLPGFINGHHHVGLTPFQMGTSDVPLEYWRAGRMAERDRPLRLDTLYSAMDMVRSGVTTVQHLRGSLSLGSSLESQAEGSRTIIDAYRELGMRVSYSSWTRDQNRYAHEPDEDFARRCPPDAAEFVRRTAESELTTARSFELFTQLANAYRDDPTVEIQLAPANLHWCSDDALRAIRDVSQAHQAPMHTHLLETIYQREYAYRRTGHSAIAHLEALGLLSPLMTLGHAVWASADDLDILAATGTRVCHNCSSNFRVRSGLAPVAEMWRRSIPVGVGIDEAGINDDRDILQELRLIATVHRAPGLEYRDTDLTGARVLRMGTEFGALTTSFAHDIGQLEVGRAADLVLVDWEAISWPFLDPSVDVVEAVVRRGRPQHIDLVMVAGRPIYQHGSFTRIDEGRILADLNAHFTQPPTADEQERRRMSGDIRRALEDAYAAYGELRPTTTYQPFNSSQ